MDDIAPGLLERIQTDFQEILGDAVLKEQTYKAAGDYAEQVGQALAQAFRRNLGSDMLPDGKMYWNIAERVVQPMLEEDYGLASDAAVKVQQALNEKAGIGIKAQRAPIDDDRVKGILNKLCDADQYDDVSWLLEEPVVNFSRSVVDNTLKANAEFQARAGRKPRIIRTAEAKCCDWCADLEGVYEYPGDVPDDIYRRHECCRCTVEYDPGDGTRQNVHTKQWTEPEERDKIKERKEIGLKSVPLEIAEHPKRLASYTPESLKNELEQAGFTVSPLKKGKLKDRTFENGGGYKVNFEDGGLLQYHPDEGSHHGGAYYKISTGKGGTKRYELDGTEKSK